MYSVLNTLSVYTYSHISKSITLYFCYLFLKSPKAFSVSLSEYCANFHYLTNDNISRQNLWRDGIHLNNVGNNIFVENFISYVNEFVLTTSNGFWLEKLSAQLSETSAKDIIHQLQA